MKNKSYGHRAFALVLLISVYMFMLVSCSGSGEASEPQEAAGGSGTPLPVSEDARYTHISEDEARELIEESGKDFILVDTRTAAIFKHDHIPGAICIPDTDITALDNDAEIPQLPDKDQMIIVYCQYGGVSKIVAEKLCDMGYTNVVEFDGMDYWEGEVESDL